MSRVTPDIIKAVEALMRRVAQTEILPHFQNLKASDVQAKKNNSPVTIADKNAEKALTEGLMRILPEALVIGEEAFEENPAILEYLKGNKPCWIIDPLDGTRNFASGKKSSAMIIALVQHDEVKAGWILDIHQGTMTYAVLGQGAFHQGKRIKAKSSLALDFKKATGYPNSHYFVSRKPNSNPDFESYALSIQRHMLSHNVKFAGCSGIEYVDVALGKAHFGFHHYNTVWDHAAGMLIVNEAGGYAGFMKGPYKPSALSDKETFLFIAHNKKIAERLNHTFRVMEARWERQPNKQLELQFKKS